MKYCADPAVVFLIFMLSFSTAYSQTDWPYLDSWKKPEIPTGINIFPKENIWNFMGSISRALHSTEDKSASADEFLINKNIIRQKEASPRKALSDYLYNMYIITALKGGDIVDKLDIRHIGAADSLENRDSNWRKIYKNEKEFIKNTLTMTFKKNLGIVYNPKSLYATFYENSFLYALTNSKNAGQIFYSGISNSKKNVPLPAAVKNGIQYQMELNRQKNNELIKVYKKVDSAAAIDQKNHMHMTYEHHPVSKECALNTYYFCKSCFLDPSFPQTYDGWEITEVYGINARPGHKGTLEEMVPFLHARNGDKTFDSGYGEWRYHTAPLMVLVKENNILYIVADPFLFDEPVQLDNWIKVFRQDTIYNLHIASTNPKWEEMIFNKDNIPNKYKK